MILEPVTASAKRSASLPAQRPTPRSVSPCPSLQYPSFQFFKPPKPLELAPSALSLATAATEHGKLGACACPSSRLPDPVPLPLTHPTPRFAPAAPLFAPVLPALESKFQFLKSPTRREGGNRDRRDLQELERHVLELVEGQRGLRRELQTLKQQAAAQSRELESMRAHVGRPKLPPTRSPDVPLPLSFRDGKPASAARARSGSRPRIAESAPGDPLLNPAASMQSRSQNWDDTVADCLLCTK
mmetsp:Transcript_44731/g.92520  ORF Transcript_44731/g.92520 Transcript_44731/m.92520 type:complete len:243 (+) Transcript_44731:85-813(+)|eukprot:s6111_g3.t1